MKDFFHGWRRKLGCVTLVLGCAVCGLWLRSFAVWDWITFYPTSDLMIELKSDRGRFGFARSGPLEWDLLTPDWTWDTPKPHFGLFAYADQPGSSDFVWRWGCAGFSVGQHSGYSATQPFVFFVAPYAAVAIPLTLLSAYLILWKPATAK